MASRPVPRRKFLAAAGAATASLALGNPLRAAARARPPLDLLLRGGMVVDGTGRPRFRADVGVRDGRVTVIGVLNKGAAAKTINAKGLVVAPGFVDIHGHTDLTIFLQKMADSKVRQGITTELVGVDGSSVLPVNDSVRAERRREYRQRYGVEIDFATWDDLFGALERRGLLTNWATMVGSGTLRQSVVGDADRPATEDELARMVALVEEARAAGVLGISSGLEYTPNAFSSTDELIALSRPFAPDALPYATHLRNEADQLQGAIAEAIDIARGAGTPLQLSHLKAQGRANWGESEEVLATIEAAARDHPVRFDVYPYTAYSTGLSSLFPAWAREGGAGAFLRRLTDPEVRAAVDEKIAMMGDWDSIQIATVGTGPRGDVVGRRLGAYAEERGKDPYDVTVELLRSSRNQVTIVGHGMSEEDVARFIAHPLGAFCSDATARRAKAAAGIPHPRAYGAFPRVFGRYVRESGVVTLEEAVRKASALPAQILGLAGRGTIVPGGHADLVVLDPESVADTATFEAPHSYPVGIPHVVVNGILAVENGEPTGAHAGRVQRPG